MTRDMETHKHTHIHKNTELSPGYAEMSVCKQILLELGWLRTCIRHCPKTGNYLKNVEVALTISAHTEQ